MALNDPGGAARIGINSLFLRSWKRARRSRPCRNCDNIVLRWDELGVLPTQRKSALAQWRGMYYILDASDGKGCVGSAYGDGNLLGRWQSYAASGHGWNTLLRKHDPGGFRFSILQRVSPDMDACDVIVLEGTWKGRLHTRAPHGLNDN
jgi:hypothetical protein